MTPQAHHRVPHLCEILRNHLSNLQSIATSASPRHDTGRDQNYYLETRFEQLKSAAPRAVAGAFRAIEDIRDAFILEIAQPEDDGLLLCQLTKVFWVSENHLYHAYAWYKLFNLSKAYNRDLMPEDLKAMASAVLSAIAIRRMNLAHLPVPRTRRSRTLRSDVRMATLLGYTLDPPAGPPRSSFSQGAAF